MPRSLAWLACALGVLMIVAAQRMSRLGSESRSYTRTRGRIVRADVEELPGPSEEGGPRYRAAVRYAFEAHGRSWASDRVSASAPAGGGTADRDDARALVSRYPAGAEVDVWFDPRDPSRSVLERGVPAVPVGVAVAVGIALLGLGVFVLAR